jgi:hypothetical protein
VTTDGECIYKTQKMRNANRILAGKSAGKDKGPGADNIWLPGY